MKKFVVGLSSKPGQYFRATFREGGSQPKNKSLIIKHSECGIETNEIGERD